MSTLKLIPLIVVLLSLSCKTKEHDSSPTQPQTKGQAISSDPAQHNKADTLLMEAYQAHGGNKYNYAHFSFDFRKKQYTFQNRKDGYRYTVAYLDQGREIMDILENGKLTHLVDGLGVEMTEKDHAKYFEAINSVIYFATLPHKLNDKAVIKTYEGSTTIKGIAYDILGITFEQKGGGKDHDDQFHYWINTETKTIDYLAYNYQSGKGGVRFRSAYNPRTVAGIRFQDYINYEAPVNTPLKQLPKLYEEGRLKELSKIELEHISAVRI
tara:strand:- start:1 stop:804 length:804 start_codon:yes stop_codon:yes gene_type:complete